LLLGLQGRHQFVHMGAIILKIQYVSGFQTNSGISDGELVKTLST
jgi:hypothetical protein